MNKLLLILTIVLLTGCVSESTPEQAPPELPKGVLVTEVPESADIIFSSIRHVLNTEECYNLNEKFLSDPSCVEKVYDAEADALGSPKQLFAMDIQTKETTQLTNLDCVFTSGQVVDSVTLMASAACSDNNNDSILNDRDKPELYLLDLATEKMDCLTCGSGLDSINNPDYSSVTKKIAFSARDGPDLRYPHHIFTVDANKNIVQLTNDSDYMEFDCAWSEDGTKIVASRVPLPVFTAPSQVWLMDSDGTNLEKITNGGSNPNNEEPHGPYPIGIDADPDLSPDNTQIVVSRLRTGKENEPFGVFELIIVDVNTKQELVLDSSYANMIPEWKSNGILFLRQTGSSDAKERKQGLYVYRNGEFEEIEESPYHLFPLGAYSCSWV